AAFSRRSASRSSTDEYRSHSGIRVDRLLGFFASRSAVPAAPRGGEVDAGKDGRERRPVDHHLRPVPVERRELEAAGFEAFGEQAPARAIEPQRLRQPPSLVEEEVQMPIDGIESETPD